MMFPLNPEGTLYSIRDEKGFTVGTGTREICEMLLVMMDKRSFRSAPSTKTPTTAPHFNVKAAIVI